MPLYNYKCRECESEYQQVNSMADHKKGPDCCGEMTFQKIAATMFNDNFLGSCKNEGYVSPLSGNFISSKSQRRSEMSEFNVVEKE